jgi:hypothetical protein
MGRWYAFGMLTGRPGGLIWGFGWCGTRHRKALFSWVFRVGEQLAEFFGAGFFPLRRGDIWPSMSFPNLPE